MLLLRQLMGVLSAVKMSLPHIYIYNLFVFILLELFFPYLEKRPASSEMFNKVCTHGGSVHA